MRAPRLALVLLFLALAPAAQAADDGQTRPRFSENFLTSSNSSVDIIATTNGTGNVKGLLCIFDDGASTVNVNFYVDGGAAQTLQLQNYFFPTDFNAASFSGWIPMNIRFSSSIRVQMVRGGSPVSSADIRCNVSWALD